VCAGKDGVGEVVKSISQMFCYVPTTVQAMASVSTAHVIANPNLQTLIALELFVKMIADHMANVFVVTVSAMKGGLEPYACHSSVLVTVLDHVTAVVSMALVGA